MKRITVALIGQPNVGKSTLFNALTGGNAIVTNWPGTTVSKSEGVIRHCQYEIHIIDLPGVYGLTAFTIEEKISRNFIVNEKPDVVVVLVDSLSLIRTLYLALDVLELIDRVVIGVTKVDEAHSRGVHINYNLLEKQLGVPVVPLSAVRGDGLRELAERIISVYEAGRREHTKVDYGELSTYIESAEALIRQCDLGLSHRWLAVKVFEGDPETLELIKSRCTSLYEDLVELREEASRILKVDPAVIVARSRFKHAESIGKTCVIQVAVRKKAPSKLFYHPVYAPLISIAIILAVFTLAFNLNTGFPVASILESVGFSELAEAIENYTISSLIERFLEWSSSTLKGLLGENAISLFLSEAVLGGVGALLLFLPLIMTVLATIGVLEDTGLLTRLAVGVHTLFEKLGFSGHALFPLSLSLGCNVPGLLVARAIPSTAERARLIMLLPFIPCQARLVVLLALATAVRQGFLLVVLSYIVAFAAFFALGFALYKWSTMRSESVEIRLLLEQPPLHKPIPRVVWWYTWWHTKHFLVKAGTIIVLANILFWLLSHVGPSMSFTDDPGESIAASFSKTLTPILKPIGISGEGSWIIALALIAGFIAKEIFISTLLTVTGASSVKNAFTTIGVSEQSVIALTIFVTLYVPCLAALSTIYSETRSLKLVAEAVLLMLVVAYTSAILAYTLALVLTL
jgi:ferrous iron transport protein B